MSAALPHYQLHALLVFPLQKTALTLCCTSKLFKLLSIGSFYATSSVNYFGNGFNLMTIDYVSGITGDIEVIKSDQITRTLAHLIRLLMDFPI